MASFVDNKTMSCVSTSHRPKGSKDGIVTDLPGVSQKGYDLTALDSQCPHSYTKEELRKMKVDELRTVAERQYLDKRGQQD